MSIYRGIGGTADSNSTNATLTEVTEQADRAVDAATDADSSASAASTSAASAASSASSASTSASTASTKASEATTSANNAATSASAASTSATAAAASATEAADTLTLIGTSVEDAADSATAAAASETAAASSASSASTSATTATTQATAASASATAASASETAAAASETAAAASESAAATSATNAASSATASASSASASATSATASAASATAAAASETAAAASESAAATSESNASTSATNASNSASAASTSATAAASSASAASTSASNASTSESNASSSASAAASSASSASASADAALAALDSFDDRYLGQKASDPTLDNDGNALIAGALYFNTTDDIMKVYEGSVWVAAYASLSGALLSANNLSDLLDASAARTNLGLGTAATTASTDYATAAQGTNADTAYGWGNHASAGYQAAATALTTSTTFSGDVSGTYNTIVVADDSHSHSTSTITGLGSLATLSAVGAAQITDNSVGAAELNVTGNGTTAQYLRSDGDGSFTWATPTDTNTTYTAGTGMSLTGTTFDCTITNNNQLTNGAGYVTSSGVTSVATSGGLTGGTITSTGTVSISSDARPNANQYFGGSGGEYFYFDNSNSLLRGYVNSAEVMRVYSGTTGVHFDGDVIAYSTTISDERLKEDIVGIDNALDKVSKLGGYTFKYKADGKVSAGVIAQQVEAVLPEAVCEKELGLHTNDDGETYKVVNYDALHGLLIEAIKELTARIEELESK